MGKHLVVRGQLSAPAVVEQYEHDQPFDTVSIFLTVGEGEPPPEPGNPEQVRVTDTINIRPHPGDTGTWLGSFAAGDVVAVGERRQVQYYTADWGLAVQAWRNGKEIELPEEAWFYMARTEPA